MEHVVEIDKWMERIGIDQADILIERTASQKSHHGGNLWQSSI